MSSFEDFAFSVLKGVDEYLNGFFKEHDVRMKSVFCRQEGEFTIDNVYNFIWLDITDINGVPRAEVNLGQNHRKDLEITLETSTIMKGGAYWEGESYFRLEDPGCFERVARDLMVRFGRLE